MTRQELHQQLAEILYIEDFAMVDSLNAAVLANAKGIGDPVWMTLIGPSSGGKSQLIRPLAKANPSLFLQLDDLTSNTLISGNGEKDSLIFRIKERGIITMDDFTVLASKNAEDRNAILGQFRMIYDGRMTKASGKNGAEPITWTGHAGMIAGSTPQIYKLFAEVADMGERFIYYRMKDMDENKAVDFVMNRGLSAKATDEKLKELYGAYYASMMSKVENMPDVKVDDETRAAIIDIAKSGTRLRTPVITDDREHFVSEKPVSELPFRVMKQLENIAKAMTVMHYSDTKEMVLPPDLRQAVEWFGYSLADDKRREYFKAVIAMEGTYIQGTTKTLKATARNISAYTGLHHTAVERGMSVLSAIGVVKQNVATHDNEAKSWTIVDTKLREIVKRIDPPKKVNEEDYQEDDSDA